MMCRIMAIACHEYGERGAITRGFHAAVAMRGRDFFVWNREEMIDYPEMQKATAE